MMGTAIHALGLAGKRKKKAGNYGMGTLVQERYTMQLAM